MINRETPEFVECPHCNGSGTYESYSDALQKTFEFDCKTCLGRGEIPAGSEL